RYGLAYSVIMCDIDAFKGYNDTYGHQAGDQVLQQVAGMLSEVVRDADSTYRFGGEEFLVVLAGQDRDSTGVAAERIRRAVAELGLPNEASDHEVVTLSIGAASWDPAVDT